MIKKCFDKLNPAAQGALCSTVTLVLAMYLLALILYLLPPYLVDPISAFSAQWGLVQRAPATLVAGCIVAAVAQGVLRTEE